MLAKKRVIFHSEADFQHALAWEFHLQSPECLIRLEFKPPYFDKRVYIDIWVIEKDVDFAIELKYKTRRLNVKEGEENFNLLTQGAQDIGRYDFLKDIQRLEEVVSYRNNIVVGYAIFLTNDNTYWKPPRDYQTIDASFRVHQDKILTGELNWGSGASQGTMRGREEALILNGAYKLNWKDYSQPSKDPYGKFKYLFHS